MMALNASMELELPLYVGTYKGHFDDSVWSSSSESSSLELPGHSVPSEAPASFDYGEDSSSAGLGSASADAFDYWEDSSSAGLGSASADA
jgi:hypothetical protein